MSDSRKSEATHEQLITSRVQTVREMENYLREMYKGLLCPINKVFMNGANESSKPFLVASGQTFSRHALDLLFARENQAPCPITKMLLSKNDSKQNYALMAIANNFIDLYKNYSKLCRELGITQNFVEDELVATDKTLSISANQMTQAERIGTIPSTASSSSVILTELTNSSEPGSDEHHAVPLAPPLSLEAIESTNQHQPSLSVDTHRSSASISSTTNSGFVNLATATNYTMRYRSHPQQRSQTIKARPNVINNDESDVYNFGWSRCGYSSSDDD